MATNKQDDNPAEVRSITDRLSLQIKGRLSEYSFNIYNYYICKPKINIKTHQNSKIYAMF